MNLFLSSTIEGKCDKLVIKLILEKCFDKYTTKFFQYARESTETTRNVIKRNLQHNEKFIVLVDRDKSDKIMDVKQHNATKFSIDEKHVIVVDRCIESWIVAGSNIEYDKCNTENITKRIFYELLGGKAYHRVQIKEHLETYDIQQGIKNNKSLGYFYKNLENIVE